MEEYLSDEFASDSEDEKRIREDQARAVRKRKSSRSLEKKGNSFKNSGVSHGPSISTSFSHKFFRGFGSRNKFSNGSVASSSASSWRRYAVGLRPIEFCFAWGKQRYWMRECPGTRNQGSSFKDT